jgi:hypothetical protein
MENELTNVENVMYDDNSRLSNKGRGEFCTDLKNDVLSY